jgi:hypothetical protein
MPWRLVQYVSTFDPQEILENSFILVSLFRRDLTARSSWKEPNSQIHGLGMSSKKKRTAAIMSATNPFGWSFSKTEPNLRRIRGVMISIMNFESKRPPGYYNKCSLMTRESPWEKSEAYLVLGISVISGWVKRWRVFKKERSIWAQCPADPFSDRVISIEGVDMSFDETNCTGTNVRSLFVDSVISLEIDRYKHKYSLMTWITERKKDSEKVNGKCLQGNEYYPLKSPHIQLQEKHPQ